MKIKYLLLENFAIVKGAMGLNKLELDFTGHDNRITLIVGSNGSGKTGGILANLHPYAGLGHLEEREDSDLIVDGKKGHKQIIFVTKKHEYVIDHYYSKNSNDRSRKISSYCKKDGIELNPTGLVTTFNATIESEFKIDINFLKLMRLGPNVTNFIKLSTNNRKSYMIKLMREIDDFLRDQKKVTERSALLNNALRIAMDKKKKLDIEDLTLLYEEIDKREKKLAVLRKEKENVIKVFFEYKGSLDTDTLDKFDSLVSNYNSELQRLRNEFNSLPKPKYVHIDHKGINLLEEYNSRLKELNQERVELSTDIATLSSKKFTLDDKLEEVRSKLTELDRDVIEIKGVEDKHEESELVKYLAVLETDIKKYEEKYKDDLVPRLTKEELNSDIDKLNMILYHIREINALSEESIEEFTKLYNKYGLDLDKISKKLHKKSRDLSYTINQITNGSNDELVVLYIPDKCECWKECPYYRYGKIKSKLDVSDKKLDTLYSKQIAYEEVSIIIGSLYAIRKIMTLRNPKITDYTVTEDGIIDSILYSDTNKFIDENILLNLTNKIESYNLYMQNKANKETVEIALERIRDKSKYRKELLKSEEMYMAEISKINNLIRKKKNKLNELTKDITLAENMIVDYNVFVQLSLNQLRISNRVREINDTLSELKKLETLKKEYDKKESEYKDKISYYNYTITAEETALYNIKKKESTFKELEKEISEIQKFYEYVELIKRSVSNKEGIPKEYVIYYCRALRNIANEIIRDIYGGDLELDVFEITDTKFNIPYITKGVRVEDIRFGSQAEVSVATIALSFAILFQFLPKYNIILLDEIDGPLHSKNKDKLFASLESHLDKIGCEQLFWITQSKLYNDYPVNLIITDRDSSDYTNDKTSIVFKR